MPREMQILFFLSLGDEHVEHREGVGRVTRDGNDSLSGFTGSRFADSRPFQGAILS